MLGTQFIFEMYKEERIWVKFFKQLCYYYISKISYIQFYENNNNFPQIKILKNDTEIEGDLCF